MSDTTLKRSNVPPLHQGEVPARPTRFLRALVAIVVAAIAVAYVARLARVMPHYGTDFDPIRYATKLVRQGKDPYAMIGPGREVVWQFRLLYPFPAVIIALPFSLVPLIVARAIFVAVTSGLLAYSVTRLSWWPLLVFASAAWWFAVAVAQWSPLMLSATSIPWVGFVIAAKPNIGLAVLAASATRKHLIIMVAAALGLTLVSFVVMPGWLSAWRDAVRGADHVRPLILQPFGVLLGLAAIKWRRPEARLLLTLALVPTNPGLYEGVLLFLIPRAPLEFVLLALLSWVVDPLSYVPPGSTATAFFGAIGRAMLLCMYVPALVMVLRRPNVNCLPPR